MDRQPKRAGRAGHLIDHLLQVLPAHRAGLPRVLVARLRHLLRAHPGELLGSLLLEGGLSLQCLTLRRGLLPQLVFRPRRTAQAILVFQDISQEMHIWRSKVDTFLADLVRQGVPLERWYFDGDPRRVADRCHPARQWT